MQNSKQQGDFGVSIAIAYYTHKGYVVSIPLTDNSRYDLIVEKPNGVFRVQCKTTNHLKGSSYVVALRTSGGNQSWKGTYKRISADECDLLFVYSFNGKCFEFSADEFDNLAAIALGKKREKNMVWEFTPVHN